MKMLLIRPDFKNLTHPPDYPTGLLYIAAAIENKIGTGNIDVVDLNKQTLPDLKEYDIIGISMLPLIRKDVWQLIEDIKQKWPNKKIILGGIFPSSIPQPILDRYPVDAIVVGEGEKTIVDLIECYEFGANIKDVKGLATRNFGMHEKNNLCDINKIDFPAYRHAQFNWYKMTFAVNHPEFKFNDITLSKEKTYFISASRGCPNIKECTFCNTPTFWQKKYRWRNAENILDEVEYLYKHYRIKVFSFNDDAFLINRKECYEFCEGLLKRNIKIVWKCDTRADVLEREQLKLMAKGGCFMIAFGIESGSDLILNNIQKYLDLNLASKTIQATKDAGIISYMLLMVGNIGESDKTINDTVKYLKLTKPDIATYVSGVMICPGTKLYEISKQKRIVTDNYWLEKNDGMPIYYDYENGITPENIIKWSSVLNEEICKVKKY